MKVLKAIAEVLAELLGDFLLLLLAIFGLFYIVGWLTTLGGIMVVIDSHGSWPSILFCVSGWVIALFLVILYIIDKVKEKLAEKDRVLSRRN